MLKKLKWTYFSLALVISASGFGTATAGDEITYTGDGSVLQIAPDGSDTANSLFTGTSVTDNVIIVNYAPGGANTNPSRVFGGVGAAAVVGGNKVLLINGAPTGNIYGGFNTRGDANGNRIELTGAGFAARNLVGGYSATGDAADNTILMSAGTANGIWGADAVGTLSNNSVTMTGGTVANYIRAASGSGAGVDSVLADNAIDMSGGIVSGGLYAAQSTGGTLRNNTVELTGGTVGDSVRAASSTNGDVFSNDVHISGGATVVSGNVLGAYTTNGEAVNNAVTVADGWIKASVWGAQGDGTSDTSYNSVTISGGKIGVDPNDGTGQVFGGSNFGAGDASNNTVTMTGGTVVSDIVGGITATGDAVNNTVTISGGFAGSSIEGGRVEFGAGKTVGNTVVIEGGDFSENIGIFGGRAYGGGEATGNTVRITGGENIRFVAGGISDDSDATDNHVVIGGGSFIAGSAIWAGNSTANVGTGGNAVNNSITLLGDVDLAHVTLLGGVAEAGKDTVTGNTLNVDGFAGAVTEVNNFQNYNFVIDSGAGTSLDIQGTNATKFDTNTNITVTAVESGSFIAPGSKITLISKTDGALDANNVDTTGIRQGTALLYDFTWDADNDEFVLTSKSARVAPSSKSHSEGRAASLAFIRQGQDFVVDTGFAAADASLGRTGAGWSRPTFFGAVGGGHFRHKTGSHVDIDGISMMTGFAWRNNGPCGSLLLGAFFEAGYADYDTRNAFDSGTVRGDGDSRYFGGGILARYDWQNGFYTEASGRVGGLKNKFHSDLTDALGNRARYDINSPYFSAHAGVGYKWRASEKALLDVSAKYLWSRQNSDSTIVTGDRVHFDDDDSHRARAGARFTYAINECVAPYVGAAFEYEFAGKARAGAYGYDFGVPTLKGGTGVGEIGVTVRRNNFAADFGVQGHVGRRDGVTGNIRLGWDF